MAKAPHNTDKRVGNMLRMRRLMLGLSQTEVANAVGVTFQQVQKYEKGTNRISASRLQEIAGLLQVPPHFFFGEALEPRSATERTSHSAMPSEVSDFVTSSDGLRLIKAFARISQQPLRKKIVKLVESISEPSS